MQETKSPYGAINTYTYGEGNWKHEIGRNFRGTYEYSYANNSVEED